MTQCHILALFEGRLEKPGVQCKQLHMLYSALLLYQEDVESC